MQKLCALLFFLITYSATQAQTYKLAVLQGQPYQELDSTDYVIPHYSPYFGNVTIKPDMYFSAFAKQYDLYDGVYTPLKQGYSYFINSQRSMTVYAAKGNFVQRPGDTSVYSFKTYQGANRRFVQQWSNMGLQGGSASDYINFQLCFYEVSGIIEMRFGSNSVSAGLWENGENGPSIGVLEMDPSFNIIYNQLWLSGNPSAPALTSAGGLINLSGTPSPGTVYRFTPAYHIGVQEHEMLKVDIYPNPAHDKFTIKSEGAFTWSLSGINGAAIMTGAAEKQSDLNVSGIAPGIYFLKVNSERLSAVKKIVIY